MSPRPRRGALGLRGRIVGLVLVTTVATLAVAALALLGPLEQSLRNAALKTLEHDIGSKPTADFARASLDLPDLPYWVGGPIALPTNDNQVLTDLGFAARETLKHDQAALAAKLGGGFVYVLGFPGQGAQSGGKPLLTTPGGDSADAGPFDDAAVAFRTRKWVRGFGTIEGTEYARVAVPFKNNGQWYVLAVRRAIDEIPGAVKAVRTAFIYAALAGLGLTLLLAIPLAGRLVSRLRRLRLAALELAHAGPAVDVPVDRARDEVGDLARTFAIMQRRLQHQEEARRAFVATASHELRTPLTSLDGMLELLDEDLGSGDPDLEDARSLLERARAQSRRLGRLAADLLDLSRIDAEVQLRSEPVELTELSRAVLAEFELGTSERGIVSTMDDESGPVWALGDPGSVARILRILLDNAVRVSPQGGEVRVELRNDPVPRLTVSDQGPGVAPEESALIFERFQRGRASGGSAGFGLGLAIGRELAERMGGELVLELSDEPGARFSLTLPAAHAPESEPAIALL